MAQPQSAGSNDIIAQRIDILDWSRAFAAVAVMTFHYFFNGIVNGKLTGLPLNEALGEVVRYGYLGVEFFFIISGYVISYSFDGKTAGQFASARALRLLPAFWAGVLITSMVSWLWGEGVLVVSGARLLANFTMVPQLFRQAYVDGVYWTLAYEMSFYALIGLGLLLASSSAIRAMLFLWVWVLLAARMTGLDFVPFLGSYFCFFAAGSVFAMRSVGPVLRVPTLLVALYLCIVFSIDNASELGITRRTVYDPIVIAALIGAMFVFFSLLDLNVVRKLRLPGARLAGGLTYPLYLVHAHIGYMTLSAFGDPRHPVASTLLMMGISLLLALAVHLGVERRYSRQWKELFARTIGWSVDKAAGWLQRWTRILFGWRNVRRV